METDSFLVRKETCVQCGIVFIIMLDEFISKLDSGMKLPRHCPCCRRENRRNPDPYRGWQATRMQYPATKGHRHQVHGGVFS